MSPGKLAAQVSHASIAFLLEKLYWGSKEVDGLIYHIGISLDSFDFTIVDCLRGGEQSLSKARVYSYNVEI